MIDRVMFFIADNIDTAMSIAAGVLIAYGVLDEDTRITMVGCTLAIMAMMLTIFV